MGLLEMLCEKLELEVSTQSGRGKKAPILRCLVILLLAAPVAAALDS